jgi:signal transduction histidine kinase
MRLTEAEWLNNHKSTWVSQALEATGWGVGQRESTLDLLDEFFDVMIEAIDTRDPSTSNTMIKRWIDQALPSELLGEKISVILFLKQLMQATYITCQTFLSGNRLTATYENVVNFFVHAFQYASEYQAQVNIKQADVNIAAIERGSQRLELSKSAFIEITAHELRTPISLIKGYANMLQSSIPLDAAHEPEQRLVNGINQGVNRLNEIINNMLLVAMIDNNRLDLSLQPVWIGKILQGIHEEQEKSFSRRNIKFFLKGSGSREKMIVGDPFRLRQAMENIITNAIKFTPDGGKVTVTLRDSNNKFIIEIEDNGIGISKTNQIRLFNKFNYLGDISHYSTTKTDFKGGGPGLGLYIAKGIIDAHHGSINVYSPGYDEERFPGTTFTVTLPMKPPHQINMK